MTPDTDTFLCPRRQEASVPLPAEFPHHDVWTSFDGARTCSWCGSLHPDDFMGHVQLGIEIGPTDKSYKVYLDGFGSKFYFQHLTETQKRHFVDLYNDRARRRYDDIGAFTIEVAGKSPMAVGYPGYFYVLPFFMGKASA